MVRLRYSHTPVISLILDPDKITHMVLGFSQPIVPVLFALETILWDIRLHEPSPPLSCWIAKKAERMIGQSMHVC